MALKPFYNKKGHLGMARQQVKNALQNSLDMTIFTDKAIAVINSNGNVDLNNNITGISKRVDDDQYLIQPPIPLEIRLTDVQLNALLNDSDYDIEYTIEGLSEMMISEYINGDLLVETHFPVYLTGEFLNVPFAIEMLPIPTGSSNISARYIIPSVYGLSGRTIYCQMYYNNYNFVIRISNYQ